MISTQEWPARRRDTYARLLVHAEPELGYPLWLTTPTEELAPKYPHKDIQIGDVGIVTPHGNFDVFFNIFSLKTTQCTINTVFQKDLSR